MAVNKKEFWGRAGSGMLYFCPHDQTVMLVLRSPEVEDPYTWGIPGGALKGTEGYYQSDQINIEPPSEASLRESAENEVMEEIGVLPEPYEELGTTIFESDGFRYTTFVVCISPEEKASIQKGHGLNWENDQLDFFPINSLPSELHQGVVFTLRNHKHLSSHLPVENRGM
jgi:8-oxo-dGTP pyrophosphatase MutT (NUDIX family)